MSQSHDLSHRYHLRAPHSFVISYMYMQMYDGYLYTTALAQQSHSHRGGVGHKKATFVKCQRQHLSCILFFQ